jgi:hypothetical protein
MEANKSKLDELSDKIMKGMAETSRKLILKRVPEVDALLLFPKMGK